MKTIIVLLLLTTFCGCSFDLSALRGGDAGVIAPSDGALSDSPGSDSFVLGEDAASDLDASSTDAAEAPDAFAETDAAAADSGPALTCTDIPDIAGMYGLNYGLMGCTMNSYGALPLTRTGACTYEFQDFITSPGNHLFNGPCTVIIEGSGYRFECNITHRIFRYTCGLTPVSGGLNVDCRYVGGDGVPWDTDPCSFFMPDA